MRLAGCWWCAGDLGTWECELCRTIPVLGLGDSWGKQGFFPSRLGGWKGPARWKEPRVWSLRLGPGLLVGA